MFMKMNHRYEIAIYINNICHIKHFFTFYKPLVKQNTTVTPKQINGKQKVSLKWGEIIGAERYNIYRLEKYNGVYVNIGTSIRNQIEDQNVKNIIIQLFLKKLEGEQKKYEKN